MAILKHIASKNADYGEAERYLIFQHDEYTQKPILDENGHMLIREEYYLDGINCDPFTFAAECQETNAYFHKNQSYNEIKSHHYIISFDPKDRDEHGLTGELAQQLGVSRNAVWKAVQTLQKEGVPMQAVSNRGYAIPPAKAGLSAPGIYGHLADPKRYFLHVHDTVTSTNTLLRELARFAPEAPLHPDTIYFGGGTPSLLSPADAARLIAAAAPAPGAEITLEANPDVVIFVDNCYGEFTQIREPLSAGADVIAGSFIKNPGGGITPTGGYIAGKADLVEKISHRFTAPGIGKDLGCTQDSLRDTFLGFYYAPGVVCEALKTAVYAQCLLELVGVNPVPRYTADHNDIVTCFDSGSAAALQGFCAGIQSCSPVDSFVSPEPADEPGYTDQVIMASGSFTEGSTIEISCDGPLRAPYTCYLQGGVNFTAGRAAVLNAVQKAFFA